MTKSTNAQAAILTLAASRQSGAVLPIPDRIKAKGATLDRSLKALLKRGWLDEREAGANDTVWRIDEAGQQKTLVISAAGFAAIGMEPPRADDDTATNAPAPRRPKGTLGEVARDTKAADQKKLASAAVLRLERGGRNSNET